MRYLLFFFFALFFASPAHAEDSTLKKIDDGKQIYVPLDPANRHYAEILKQVKEGTLTIKDAD